MSQSPTIGALAAALAKAQGAMSAPSKNKTVRVTSQKGSYSFKYSTLDAVMESIRKPLSDNGLSITQGLSIDANGGKVLVTTLMHESGEWISNGVPIEVSSPGMQPLGSAISYGRRYGISTLISVVADEDDDGNAADGNKAEVISEKPLTQPSSTTNLATLLRALGKRMKELGVGVEDLPKNPREMTELELAETISNLNAKETA